MKYVIFISLHVYYISVCMNLFVTWCTSFKCLGCQVGHRLRQPMLNSLNAELNPLCHLLALLGAHHILYISRIRVNQLFLEQTLDM